MTLVRAESLVRFCIAGSGRTLLNRVTYNRVMRSYLLRVAVLASALLLALPPGWCQAVSAHCRVEKVVPAATCCHEAQQDSPESQNTPVPSSVQCCCSRDAAPIPESVQAPDDHGVSLFTVSDDLTAITCPQVVGGYSALADLHAGPPLRILQCVWRC